MNSLTVDDIIFLVTQGCSVTVSPDGSFEVRSISSPKSVSRNQRYYSRAKARNLPVKEWEQRRLHVLNRDGHKCTYCGSDGNGKALHCDHVIPLARGGSSEVSNLTTACKRCNSSKKDKPLEVWRASR